MRALRSPSGADLKAAALTITEPEGAVDVTTNRTRTRLWVHVGGICLLHIARIRAGTVDLTGLRKAPAAAK